MKKKILIIAAIVLVAMVGCTTAVVVAGVSSSTSGPDKDALAQSSSPAAPVEETSEAPAPAPEPAPEPTKAASSCDDAREAILTGSKADITRAFQALIKDKGADATAREYARYYLVRDKGQADVQEMDISLIQMSCTM